MVVLVLADAQANFKARQGISTEAFSLSNSARFTFHVKLNSIYECCNLHLRTDWNQ